MAFAICLYISAPVLPAERARILFMDGISLLDQCGQAANHLHVSAHYKTVMKGGTLSRMLPRLREFDFTNVNIASTGRFERPEDIEASRNIWRSKCRILRESGGLFEPMRWRHTFFAGIVVEEPSVWADVTGRMLALCATVPDGDNAYILLTRQESNPESFDCETGLDLMRDTFRSLDEITNRQTWTWCGAWLNKHLRDVYPVNILRNEFLLRTIEGVSLSAWVGSNPRRGTLEPLTSGLTIWRPDLRNLPELRKRLFAAGLLHWHGHYPHKRGYRKPNPLSPEPPLPDEVPAMFDTPDEFFGEIPITR
jgi:hypothetical protein